MGVAGDVLALVSAARDDASAGWEAVVGAAILMGSGRESSDPGAGARPSVGVAAVAVRVGTGRRVTRSAAG